MLKPDFVVADTHWSLKKLCNFYSFKDTKEYIESWIREYNLVVQGDSVVYFLGDLGYKPAIEEIMPKLKGIKVLIKGNHDTYSNEFYKQYFERVYVGPVFTSQRVVLSHIPIPVEEGVLNVHGHTHRIILDSPNHFNACWEVVGLKPLPYKMFEKMVDKLPKPNYKFLEEWYKDIQKPIVERKDLVLKEDGTIDVVKSKEKKDL